jgi:hypothetical protein
MRVAPDLEADRVTPRPHYPLAHGFDNIEVTPPDHDDKAHGEHGR